MTALAKPVKVTITFAGAASAIWGGLWLAYTQLNWAASIDASTYQYVLFLLIGVSGLLLAETLRHSGESQGTVDLTPFSDRIKKIENSTGFFKEEISKLQTRISDVAVIKALAPPPEPPVAPNPIENKPVEDPKKKEMEEQIRLLTEKIEVLEKSQEEKDATNLKLKEDLEAARKVGVEIDAKLKKTKEILAAAAGLFEVPTE